MRCSRRRGTPSLFQAFVPGAADLGSLDALHGMTAMRINRVSAGLLLLISSQCFAEEPRGVPEKLFGVTLGGIYDLGNPEIGDFGDIPVKKFAGINRFLGQGIHYYFQPKENHKFFEYAEKREKPKDKYVRTSFRLYLLPVIPPEITTIDQLNEAKLKWEVSVIEWSNDPKTKDDAYYWAIDLCKTFAVDISVNPEITDHFDSKWYECTFSTDDREFKVSSFYSKSVQLSYKKEVSDSKNKSVERAARKLQVNEIRPY